MRQTSHILPFAALVVSLVSLAYGLNFMYYSDVETTVFGEHIYFWSGDTLTGPVRSNDRIALEMTPQFYDYALTTAPDFYHGPGYNPGFHGPAPIFSAPRLELPQSATSLREQAIAQGQYFNAGDSMMARVHIEGDSLQIWWMSLDAPFDTSAFTYHALPESAVVFFDCPIVHLWGTVSTTLIFGCAGQAGLEDNILYASSNAAQHGRPAPNHPEKFALVAEDEIKVMNTWANGREDSHNRGNNQTNPDSADIYLDGLYFALNGSFTFEQQNDPDSGYVYQDPPGTPHWDDRGTIYLWGGLTNRERGYLHRSNNGSTGYLKNFRYDEELRSWNVGVFTQPESVVEPTFLDFGTALVGHIVSDTIHVSSVFSPITVDSLHVSGPFIALPPDTSGWDVAIVVGFAPSDTGTFNGNIHIFAGHSPQWISLDVRGRGVNPLAADTRLIPYPLSLNLSASPNPFNPTTRIVFDVPLSGRVRLDVYDISGRLVRTLANGTHEAGKHVAVFDGTDLTSGIYFASLRTGDEVKTQKLLLLK